MPQEPATILSGFTDAEHKTNNVGRTKQEKQDKDTATEALENTTLNSTSERLQYHLSKEAQP